MSRLEGPSALAQRRTTYQASPSAGGLGSLRALAPFAALDGMRGLAVTGLLLAASGWTAFGSLGLDVFFVITGFLITLMLLRELHRFGRIDFRRYAVGRAKRIVPAGIVALSVVLILTWQWGSLEEMQRTAMTAVLTVAQLANWGQLFDGGSFTQTAGLVSSLGHAWALSLTVQFLVVWPFVLLAVWKLCRGDLSRVLGTLAVIFLAAAVVAPSMAGFVSPDRILLGTDTRFVAFAAGAVAAAFFAWRNGGAADRSMRRSHAGRNRGALLTGVGVASVVLLVVAGVVLAQYIDFWLYRGGLAAIAMLVALVVLTLCTRENALLPVLQWAPLAAVGRRSFGVFLFHLPVYWLLQRFADGSIAPPLLFLCGGAISWFLAAAIHYVVTLPSTQIPWSIPTGSIALAVSVALIAGLAIALPADRISAALAPGESSRPTVLTVGDSLARDFASMLTDSRRQEFGVRDLGLEGCGLIETGTARCDDWPADLASAISETSPDAVLLHASADAGMFVDGARLSPCDPGFQDGYRARFAKLLEITRGSASHPVVLISNERNTTGQLTDAARVNCFNAVVWDLAAENPGVELVNWNAGLCADDGCRQTTAAGRPLFRGDGVHMTQVGMADLAPWLEQSIMAGIKRAKEEASS